MNGLTADPEVLIEHAIRAGWRVVPQLLYRDRVNALMRTVGPHTDLVTIPLEGWSTVIRLAGGPCRGDRRRSGTEIWRHRVPLQLALVWLNSDPADDAYLSRWDSNIWRTAAPRNDEGEQS